MCGLLVMLATGAIKWNKMDEMVDGGVKMMGFIAFVMLVAAGYANVLRETHSVEAWSWPPLPSLTPNSAGLS